VSPLWMCTHFLLCHLPVQFQVTVISAYSFRQLLLYSYKTSLKSKPQYGPYRSYSNRSHRTLLLKPYVDLADTTLLN